MYLVIHSGSRNLGTQVANYYQDLASDLNAGKEDLFRGREELIRTYKEQGRRSEIQKALKELEKDYKAKEPTLPRDLCYLYGEYMEHYLHDVRICQQFAKRNREKMGEILLARLGLTAKEAFHTVHNYIAIEEGILRKGAVSAAAGEKLLIPINMRDGSLLCIGKGNPEWNLSAPHGAGRACSRTDAKHAYDLDAYQSVMREAGIYTTTATKETLDECPMAYKSPDRILPYLSECVEITDRLTPIYNFKAAD